MYLVILASMLAAYVSSPDVGLAPGIVKFLPDLLSICTAVYVVLAGTRQRFRYVGFKYWLIFAALTLALICGPLVNHEAPGPIINGMRYYLRAIPFFFLPAVVAYSEEDLKRFMYLILGLSLLQCPIAAYQRYTVAENNQFSGDPVIGTLMISGILSLFLISVLCIMGSLMVRGRVGKLWYACCFVTLVLPMSINETKVTIFLLPLALLVTFALAARPGRRIPVTLSALALLVLGGAIFVPLYNYFNTLHNPVPFTVQEFLTNSELFNNYMSKSAGVGTDEEAGRTTSLVAPFMQLGHDPINLTLGLGIGNVSQSSLGTQFTGHFATLYWNFAHGLSLSMFLFEIGLFGTTLVLLLHWMVLRDALYVSHRDSGLLGALAPGYVGAWLTITVGLLYLTIHTFESLSFMFWFFSGLLAARRKHLEDDSAPAAVGLRVALTVPILGSG
ncbi:MAG TPA: hypothetical protein VIY90_03145 [Steroidobacteraceae bacterium]